MAKQLAKQQESHDGKLEGKLFLVETKDEVFWSTEKIDAIYKHIEYPYGKARYKEVRSDYKFPEGKKRIKLNDGTLTEA